MASQKQATWLRKLHDAALRAGGVGIAEHHLSNLESLTHSQVQGYIHALEQHEPSTDGQRAELVRLFGGLESMTSGLEQKIQTLSKFQAHTMLEGLKKNPGSIHVVKQAWKQKAQEERAQAMGTHETRTPVKDAPVKEKLATVTPLVPRALSVLDEPPVAVDLLEGIAL